MFGGEWSHLAFILYDKGESICAGQEKMQAVFFSKPQRMIPICFVKNHIPDIIHRKLFSFIRTNIHTMCE